LDLAPQEIAPTADLMVALGRHAERVCADEPRCGGCPLVSFCAVGAARLRAARDGTPTVLDLFAGAGGFAFGFRKEGFRVVLAVEKDRDAAQTYRLNNPGVPVWERDVTTLDAGAVADFVGDLPTVLCAGPPCQSYSAAGRRLDDDPGHTLYRYVLSFAARLQPAVVVIENVPGMTRRMEDGRVYRDIVQEEMGVLFDAECNLLDASTYGVPQLRRRFFFFGRRRGTTKIGIPDETHARENPPPGKDLTPTVIETLRGLPRRGAGCLRDFHRSPDGVVKRNVATMDHSRKVVKKIRDVRPGEGPLSYRRVHKDFARTVVAGHRALPVHPTANRALSVREAARIQGFPDSYVFLGPRASQPLQVANAIPPALARAIAAQIRRHLERHDVAD
jgi:DNA (cytosine-5)-methyltransferase 1